MLNIARTRNGNLEMKLYQLNEKAIFPFIFVLAFVVQLRPTLSHVALNTSFRCADSNAQSPETILDSSACLLE